MSMTEAEWQASKDPEKMLGFLLGKEDARWWRWLGWPGRRGRPIQTVPKPLPSSRKLRLFACACCRRIWGWLRDERSQEAVEASERFADGQAGEQDLALAEADAWAAVEALQPAAIRAVLRAEAVAVTPGQLWPWAARAAAESASGDVDRAAQGTQAAVERAGMQWAAEGQDIEQAARAVGAAARATLLRDIFGNPFRPAVITPGWRAPSPTALAQGIYDDRTFAVISGRRRQGLDVLAQGIYDDRNFDTLGELADALEEAGCDDADILQHCRQPGEHVRGCWVLDLVLGKT